MEEVTFTGHCRLQMRERHITEKAILSCLKSPDKVIFQSNHRFRGVKKIGKFKKVYLMVVVFDQFPNLKEVVTVFYTSKLHKYL